MSLPFDDIVRRVNGNDLTDADVSMQYKVTQFHYDLIARSVDPERYYTVYKTLTIDHGVSREKATQYLSDLMNMGENERKSEISKLTGSLAMLPDRLTTAKYDYNSAKSINFTPLVIPAQPTIATDISDDRKYPPDSNITGLAKIGDEKDFYSIYSSDVLSVDHTVKGLTRGSFLKDLAEEYIIPLDVVGLEDEEKKEEAERKKREDDVNSLAHMVNGMSIKKDIGFRPFSVANDSFYLALEEWTPSMFSKR